MRPRSTKRANKEMEERLRVFEKKVEAQRFVMTNLRNGIDYLKDQGLNSTQFENISKSKRKSDFTWTPVQSLDVRKTFSRILSKQFSRTN